MYPIETIKWINFVGFTGIHKIQEGKEKKCQTSSYDEIGMKN